VRVRVALTPREEIAAPVGVALDVLRCTSTICQALAAGVTRVTCVEEIDDARALAGAGVGLAGERENVLIPGFDFGNSPREFVDLAGAVDALVLTTTNGTRLLVGAAERCETVYVGSMLNLGALVKVLKDEEEVVLLCAGVEGEFALDDAYLAGRIAIALGGEPDDGAIAAMAICRGYNSAFDALCSGVSAANLRNAGLAEDIAYCAQDSIIDLVPQVVERVDRSVVVA